MKRALREKMTEAVLKGEFFRSDTTVAAVFIETREHLLEIRHSIARFVVLGYYHDLLRGY